MIDPRPQPDRYFATAIPARETVRTTECRCGCIPGQACHSDGLVCDCDDCYPCRAEGKENS